MRVYTAAAVLLWVALLAGGASAATVAPGIVVTGAWSRPAIGTGVVYLRIVNRGGKPDRLDAARTPVAKVVELHRSMDGSGSMDGMKMTGVMSMERVNAVTVPARGSVTFAPGGYHLMAIGLRGDLHPKERFPVQLHFAAAGWTSVTVTVRPI